MKNFTATPSWARSVLTLSMGWWLCTAYGTLQGSATQEEFVVKRLVVVDDEDRAQPSRAGRFETRSFMRSSETERIRRCTNGLSVRSHE